MLSKPNHRTGRTFPALLALALGAMASGVALLLPGTGYAAAALAPNSVGSAQIKDGASRLVVGKELGLCRQSDRHHQAGCKPGCAGKGAHRGRSREEGHW
jgi:hypothetical protein